LKNRIASVLNAPGSPFAVELVDNLLAERIGISAEPQLLVRIGGNSAAVHAQRTAISALGGPRVMKQEVWDQLRVVEDKIESPIVLRVSATPATIGELWTEARKTLREIPGAMMHSTPSLGIVRCILPASTPVEMVSQLASKGASVVYERMPAAMWHELSPSVVGDRISQGIKRAFDPANILNPGILGPSA
jgi:FAD/FMN-containing dehydrogenase